MNVIAQDFHSIGEANWIGLHVTTCVTIGKLPAIVQVDVFIAQVGQTDRDEHISGVLDKLLRNITRKLVPRVPAHLRGSTEAIIESRDLRC